jgi:hypothetical protein
MAESRSKLRDLIAAFRNYADERKRPRVCPVCAEPVVPIGDGKLFACRKPACGWQGISPYRA